MGKGLGPALMVFVLAMSAPVAADVCRWTDADGVIHFAQRCDPNTRAERRWHGGTRSYRGGDAVAARGPVLTEREVIRAPANVGDVPRRRAAAP